MIAKRVGFLAATVTVTTLAVILLVFRLGPTGGKKPTRVPQAETVFAHSPQPLSQMAVSESKLTSARASWMMMPDDQRLEWLERLGEVPEYGEMPRDWLLAERTSWWGKPLDPRAFWTNRVIWLDASAFSSAKRRGRAFPPPPFRDPRLPKYNDAEEVDGRAGTVEGPNIRFRWNATEAAFWTKFSEEHPRPPERLEGEQNKLATRILAARHDFHHGGNPAKLSSEALALGERLAKKRTLEAKYPPEMVSDEALYWAYVLDQRHNYQGLLDRGYATDGPFLRDFCSRLLVDPKVITEPLSAEQSKAESAWKIAYLQRLRREKTDESYINAYLNAWNLSSADVFGGQ